MRLSAAITAVLFLLASSATGCAYDIWAWLEARTADDRTPVVEASHDFRVETVAEGFESPWAIAFVPDGRILVTERPGRLRVVTADGLASEPLRGVPRVEYKGQGGLLDIALHPDFADNKLVYLSYSVRTDGGRMVQISRHVLGEDALTDMQTIFRGHPVENGKSKHYGCRIVFGPDGLLYVTQGERGEGERAQDLMDLNGKTLRLTEDGAIPETNPFVGRDDARPEIFTYGNRNSQGMAFQPETGLCFQTEHGPSWDDAPGGGDEVNIIEAGANYGWPVIHHQENAPGMVPPLLEYTPAIAPSGATFYTHDAFPDWRGDFFFATLVGEKLIRVELEGRKVVAQEFMLEEEYGRLRDVAQGPRGALYVLTSQTDHYGPGREGGDRLLRLAPTK